MSRLGMDDAAVEGIANRLHQQAQQLEQAMNQIGSLVSQAVHAWDGPDSRQFDSQWNGHYKAAVKQAAEAVEQMSQVAKRNVNAQREVSRNS